MTVISPFLLEYKILPGYPGCCEQGEEQRTEGPGSRHWHRHRTLVNDGSHSRCRLLLCHRGKPHSSHGVLPLALCLSICSSYSWSALSVPSTGPGSESIELDQVQFLPPGACFSLWELFSCISGSLRRFKQYWCPPPLHISPARFWFNYSGMWSGIGLFEYAPRLRPTILNVPTEPAILLHLSIVWQSAISFL